MERTCHVNFLVDWYRYGSGVFFIIFFPREFFFIACEPLKSIFANVQREKNDTTCVFGSYQPLTFILLRYFFICFFSSPFNKHSLICYFGIR